MCYVQDLRDKQLPNISHYQAAKITVIFRKYTKVSDSANCLNTLKIDLYINIFLDIKFSPFLNEGITTESFSIHISYIIQCVLVLKDKIPEL